MERGRKPLIGTIFIIGIDIIIKLMYYGNVNERIHMCEHLNIEYVPVAYKEGEINERACLDCDMRFDDED